MRFCEIKHASKEYEKAVELRRLVLRKPLGLDFTEHQLKAEAADIHLSAWDNGELVGCVVLTPTDEIKNCVKVVKLRQMAVDPNVQRKGIGKRLISFAERVAVARGSGIITLHARATAVPFYERLGYCVVGEPFEEVTIPHREMEKVIVSAASGQIP